MTSRVQPKVETLGDRTWHTVLATGRYRPVLPIGTKAEAADLTPGYAQINIVPELTDVPFALRCWAPAEVIQAETAAIRAWAASVEYPAKG